MKSIRETVNEIKDVILAPAPFVGLYIAASVAVNAIAMPIVTTAHTIESYVARPQIRTGELVEKKLCRGPYDFTMYVGKLELPSGEIIEVVDDSNIIEGKWRPNSVMGEMEVGKDYTFNSLDWPVLDYHKLMSAEEVK